MTRHKARLLFLYKSDNGKKNEKERERLWRQKRQKQQLPMTLTGVRR